MSDSNFSLQRRIQIKELNPDLIPPSTKTYKNYDQGGSKIVVIGKPGTGKNNTYYSSFIC